MAARNYLALVHQLADSLHRQSSKFNARLNMETIRQQEKNAEQEEGRRIRRGWEGGGGKVTWAREFVRLTFVRDQRRPIEFDQININ